MNLIRHQHSLGVFFVLYCLVTLALACIFSPQDFSPLFATMLCAVGIVVYIMALVALLVMHDKEGRSSVDGILVLLYPYLVYYLMFFSFSFKDKSLWILVGYLYFLIITGGFVLGIVFAPLIAKWKAFPPEEIRGTLRYGFDFLKRRGAVGEAIVLFTGIFIALIYFLSRFLLSLSLKTSYQQVVFYFFLLVGLTAIGNFTFRHTIFNLHRNGELKRQYDEEKERSQPGTTSRF